MASMVLAGNARVEGFEHTHWVFPIEPNMLVDSVA